MSTVSANNNYEILLGPQLGTIFTAESFLQYLRLSNDIWWAKGNGHIKCPWVFRGHASDKWNLVPSAVRKWSDKDLAQIAKENLLKSPSLVDLADKPFDYIIDKEQNDMTLGLPSISLRTLLTMDTAKWSLFTFHSMLFELGIINQKPDRYQTTRYNRMMDLELYLSSEIAHLAQHHGIPTFLLDWTLRPEIAAHFAVEARDQTNQNDDLAVFAYRFNPNEPNDRFNSTTRNAIKYITASVGQNTYLAAQQGAFTFPGPTESFAKNGIYISLEETAAGVDEYRNADGKGVILRKMILDSSEVNQLKKLILREGISEVQLKPSLDNVADAVKKLTFGQQI